MLPPEVCAVILGYCLIGFLFYIGIRVMELKQKIPPNSPTVVAGRIACFIWPVFSLLIVLFLIFTFLSDLCDKVALYIIEKTK